MEFLLTSYVYPLAEPIVLSVHFGYSLDNPRTELEMKVVKDYLLMAYESGYDYTFPVQSEDPIVTIEKILAIFKSSVAVHDPIVREAFERFEIEHAFDFIASIWVIARFDDEGVGQELRERERQLRVDAPNSFTILEDDHLLIQKPKELASYCFLLSLLCHTEKDAYFGRTFLADPHSIDFDRPTEKVWREFLMLSFHSQSYLVKQDDLDWMFLPCVRDSFVSVGKQLDVACGNGQSEKLLYIGSLLKIIGHDTRDTKTQVLLLTSIIELLLTHNPDFSRFNVEDSINKQFQLKASILIYLNDKSRDINAIKSRLKVIYQQRSNIAHGNFQAFEKYKASLSKKEGQEEYLDDLVTDLYVYIRAILEELLRDFSFVEFLKNG